LERPYISLNTAISVYTELKEIGRGYSAGASP
jgi:hypothetical protein